MAHDGMDFRSSSRDRERVENLLRTAYDDGRLTTVEFGDRLQRVHEASTYRELEAIVADLPYDHEFLYAFCRPAQPPAVEVAPHPSAVRTLRTLGFVFGVLFALSLMSATPLLGGALLAILIVARISARPRRRSRSGWSS